jgi:hypothetical protein
MRAVTSVLKQAGGNVTVILSDNSTDLAEANRLEKWCLKRGDKRLHYIRPPESLAMTDHWNWAMEQALARDEATHFIYLTDRMMFKPVGLAAVLEAASLYPDRVISYNHDMIVDHEIPLKIEQSAWSGALVEVDSERLLYLSSHEVIHPCLPRMLNCIAPRATLEALRTRFGYVFSSISPDFAFCFRCLDLVDSFLYFDLSPIFHYALHRSNGASMSRGVTTRDHKDFVEKMGGELRFSTPIPNIVSVRNAIFHEYCEARRERGSGKFPDLDMEYYLRQLAEEVEEVEASDAREEVLAKLIAHGWVPPERKPEQSRSLQRFTEFLSPRAVRNKLVQSSIITWTAPLWLAALRWFGIRPLHGHHFRFRNLAQAMEYMIHVPRKKEPGTAHLQILLEPKGRILRAGRDVLSYSGR